MPKTTEAKASAQSGKASKKTAAKTFSPKKKAASRSKSQEQPTSEPPKRNRARIPLSASSVPASASDAVDAQLVRYREMRDFDVTREPRGAEIASTQKGSNALPFVIQKHAATRLHYDFRLGLHGVLKSWAVTKGPSYFPGDKRLAVQVEDHPMEYGGFEGIIPKGQYGGGTVMLWDEGTWEPLGDPDEGLAKGNLKFILRGHKLHGKWVLIRMSGHAATEAKPNWLLIKEHDEHERSASDTPIVEESPDSVITQRDLDAIARAEDHIWGSKARDKNTPEQKNTAGLRRSAAAETAAAQALPSVQLPAKLPGAKQSMPAFIAPQLASQADHAPSGPNWLHELKLDGYRIQAHLTSGTENTAHKAILFTRNGLDWTHRMFAVARELERLPIENAVIDGEVVVLDEHGQTSFAELQAAFDEGRPNPLSYYAFDLLYLNGHSLLKTPLLERKQLLTTLVSALDSAATVRISEHLATDGDTLYHEACRLGAEGIISKLASGPYVSGRTASWVKVKCIRQQEFVIGGFTLPTNGGNGIGALLLGYYHHGKLIYAGRTGTGFTQKSSALIREKLEALRQSKSVFEQMETAAKRGAIYVDPKLVAQIQFRTWTADHLVRQASFKGLREDKAAAEVRREEPDAKLSAKLTADAATAAKTQPKAESPAKHAKPPMRSSPLKPAKKQPTQSTTQSTAQSTAHSAAVPTIRVTHPDKIIDPQSRLTKQALVDYYLAVADRMLPHVTDRPLSLVRCPDGAGTQCFYQKHVGRGLPRGVHGVNVPNKKTAAPEEYVTLSTAEGLAGLAQMNVLEVHPWGSTNQDLEHPDRITFDLDPDEAISWRTLCDGAEDVRDRLRKLGLTSFLKSTGGKGLHIVAPLTPKEDWATVKAFAHAFTLQMEAENTLYISKMSKTARKKRIFVDYLRNERGATAVAAYSSRARLGIPASVPLEWSELKNPQRPHFAVADFANWSERLKHDPWVTILTTHQEIAPGILIAIRA